MLSVVCWKWKGYRNVYRAEHVNKLQRMLREHLKIPHRLLCITDDPRGLECDTAPLWGDDSILRIDGPLRKPRHIRGDHNGLLGNCFHRLRLFHPEVAERIGPRILSMDLDVVIYDDMSDILPVGRFKIMGNTVAKYNGSMWYLEPGMHRHVWDMWDGNVEAVRASGHIGSDQAWMSMMIPDAETWDGRDGLFTYRQFAGFNVLAGRATFFSGKTKPWDDFVVRTSPAIAEVYRQA